MRASIGCGRPSRSATRAAIPTGQSAPGRDDPVDVARPGEPVDRRPRPRTRAIARSSASAKPTACGSRSTAITSRSPRPARPRAGRAAPGRRLGRGDADASEDAAPPGLVLAVPRDGPLEPVLEPIDARQPVRRSSLSVEPMWRSTCPGRSSTWTTSASGLPTASSTSSAISATVMSIPVATLTTSPATRSSGASISASIASACVVDVEPVAARVAVAVDRQRLPGERLRDEAGHDLLRDAGAARSC